MSENTNTTDLLAAEITAIIQKHFPIKNPEDNLLASSILEYLPKMSEEEKQSLLAELQRDIAD